MYINVLNNTCIRTVFFYYAFFELDAFRSNISFNVLYRYISCNKNFHGNVIYQKTSFLVNGRVFKALAKAQLAEERLLLYFFSEIPEAILKPSTNESPIVSERETFVDRLQFFCDARRHGVTYRRRVVCRISTAFNQWISLILCQQSECHYRSADISDRLPS